MCRKVFRFVIFAYGEFIAHPVQFLFKFEDFGKGRHRFIDHGFALRHQHILVQIAECKVPRHHYITFLGRHFAGDDLQKRGFACAITAYKTHAFAWFEYEIDVIQQNAVTVLNVDVRER